MLPTTVTEQQLADYAWRQTRAYADVLGWTVSGADYAEPVALALYLAGVDDLADVTSREQVAQIRALVLVTSLEAIVRALGTRYDVSADGSSFTRSQMRAAAERDLAMARETAATYGVAPAPQAVVLTRRYTDAYTIPADGEEFALV